MQKKKRIVIAEDHTVLRQGLKMLLNETEDLEVVGEAGDGMNAIRCIKNKTPDLVLLDLSMPKMGGLSVIKELAGLSPEIKLIALTMHKNEEYVLEAFKSGARGYCLKSADHDELLLAIRTVLSGKVYVSPDISDQVLEGYLEKKKTIKKKTSWETLTRREKQVLKLVAEGSRNKEIADCLGISLKTVEKHRANIMEKLNLHNVSALTAYAVQNGLVKP